MDQPLGITTEEFIAIRDLLYERSGIYLKDSKQTLVISRFRSRLQELKCKDFTDYLKILRRPGSSEHEYFVNVLTTNETCFFRHPQQYNFLCEHILPELYRERRSETVNLWSAACSTGEEPFSLAITCREFSQKNPAWRYKVYGSDINNKVIKTAEMGLYPERSMKEVSPALRDKYFQVTSTGGKNFYKISEIVRREVEFSTHNLLAPFRRSGFHVIFICNALIYSDIESKRKIVSLLEQRLVPGGYLFVGLSETLNDVQTSLRSLRVGVYKKFSEHGPL
jgi:chemotaxis protein methyltransferase CheR